MGSFSFKSVGITADQSITQSNAVVPSDLPIGIKTPLRLSAGSLFTMTYKSIDQVTDNLRNLLLTNHGERIGQFNFGADIRPLLSDFASPNFDSNVMTKITTAVSQWMPYVSLEDFQSTYDRSHNQSLVVINLQVTYTVPALTGDTKYGLSLTLYAL